MKKFAYVLSSKWRSPWRMAWVGFVIRVLYITVAHSYIFERTQDHFHFGWEMGRIAAALAAKRGYADPFVPFTGPTAWVPPLYPLLLAGVFKTFGTYTLLSGWAILVLNSIFSAITIPAVHEIAERCYGPRVALWAAWIWTLYPAAMQYAVRWVWEMSLTCLLFSWALVLALRLRRIGDSAVCHLANRTGLWAFFGLFWGLIALSNPTLLLFLPICGVWCLLASGNLWKDVWRAALAALIFCSVLGPWTYRNYVVFGEFIPIRDNLGAELWEGSGPHSNGFPWGATLPIVDRAPEIELYRRLGEVRYVEMQGDKAKAFIRAHPEHFVTISLKRFYFFWASVPHPSDKHELLEYIREFHYCFLSISGILGLALSLKNRIPGAKLFAWAFFLLPLTYYFVTPGARFRHPLEPLIVIVTVYLFQSAKRRTGRSSWLAQNQPSEVAR